MKFKVVISDIINDKRMEFEIISKSVFDAIDEIANRLDNPDNYELIEAVPFN